METLRLGSRGSEVKLLQSILGKIGYDSGAIDGVFGQQTRQAVIAFQSNNGLIPDGIVGPATGNLLEKFLLGYDTYSIRPGDTFYNIAARYYTTVNAILTANPGLNPNNLQVGQRIIVPYGIDVVLTDVDYTYEIMERAIRGLKARYPFIQTGIAGKSVLGKNLYFLRLGNGPTEVSYNGSHHGIEWITTPLLMKFIENYAKAYATGRRIRGYDIRSLFRTGSIYIIPMVNPDGVNIAIDGPQPNNPYYNDLLRWNNTGLPFSRVWKANTRGVDLNRNYPASWQQAKNQEAEFGITGPAPTRYGGPAPLSEPESQAMVNFTRQHNFKLVIAYHTQGRVIYWLYQNIRPPRALEIAEVFSAASGYTISDVPYEAAYAGYKDWFVEVFRRPGYTIEAGIGTNPVPLSQFDTIYQENEEIMLLGPIV